MHTATSFAHYRQSKSSPTSLEESTEYIHHALYPNSNNAQAQAPPSPAKSSTSIADLIQPRDELQKYLWEQEANRRLAGNYVMPVKSEAWDAQGRTIYDAPRKPVPVFKPRNAVVEPCTPVSKPRRNVLQSLHPARAGVPPQTPMPAATLSNKREHRKPLDAVVCEKVTDLMRLKYPTSVVPKAPSPCPSRTPSLSDGSDSCDEDSLSSLDGSQAGDDQDGMEYEDSPAPSYEQQQEANQYSLKIFQLQMEVEMKRLAQQEAMLVEQEADMLFAEFINVGQCSDDAMEL